MTFQYNVLVLLPGVDGLLSELPTLISLLEKASSTRVDVQVDSDKVGNRVCGFWEEWALFLAYSEASYILQESQEIARKYASLRSDGETIARCGSRIELWSDPDPEMQHFNDYINVLEQIEAAFPTAILFDAANEVFI